MERDYAKEVMAEIEVFNKRRRKKRSRHRPAASPTIKNQYRDLIRSYDENKECQI